MIHIHLRKLGYKVFILGYCFISIVLLLSSASAFLEYVFLRGQISFWAANVTTNLLSMVTYATEILIEWIWGGVMVGNPTLIRFFAKLKFLLLKSKSPQTEKRILHLKYKLSLFFLK